MKAQLLKDSTDVSLIVFIQDSSSTTGAGLTGLAYDSGSLVCYYVRPGEAAAELSLATMTVTGAHSDGGFVEIDSTNMPGFYRLDLSDAIVATGADSVAVMLKGATNMAPVTIEIQLTDVDLNDAVRGGMTALPNAAQSAAGGIPIKTDLVSNMTIAKNTALSNFMFVLRDSTNHEPKTSAASIDGQVSIDGAAFAALTNAEAEIGSGVYKVDLAAADVNGDTLMFKFTATDCDTTFIFVRTQS